MARLPSPAPEVGQRPSAGDALRAASRRLLRRAADNWLVLTTGIAAALPVIIATVQALVNQWVPLQDDGIIVLRSWDVLTDQSPLVGQYSQATLQSVGNAYSPGPLLYWLLALPVRVGGMTAVPLTIGLVNVASIVAAIALASRRGGTAFMLATAAGVVLVCRSLPEEVFVSPFNPTVPILPSLLLIFLAWSLACREIRVLPVTALVASFVTQTHLSYVPLTVALLAIGIGGLVYEERRIRRRRRAAPLAISALRRSVLTAMVVVAVCWTPPLVDLVVHDPSNVEVLARTVTADRPKLGSEAAWNAAVRAFGVPPWWLEDRVDALGRFLGVARAPGLLSSVSFVLVAAAMVWVGLAAWRRRRVVAYAAALAFALIPAFAFVAGSTPSERVLTIGYTMQWGSAAGMFAWLTLMLGLLSLPAAARLRLPHGARTSSWDRRAPVLAGLAVVSVLGAGVGIAQPPDGKRALYEPARTAIHRLESALPAGRTVFLADVPFEVQGAFAYALRRHGVRPLVAPNYVEATGSFYDVTGRGYDHGVVFRGGKRPAPPGGRILARIEVPGPRPAGMNPTVTLALGPGGVGQAK